MGTSPAIMLMSVDLPQPLGPNTETILDLGMSRSKFSYSGQPAKYLVRPRMVICVPGAPGTKGRCGTSATTAALLTLMAFSFVVASGGGARGGGRDKSRPSRRSLSAAP